MFPPLDREPDPWTRTFLIRALTSESLRPGMCTQQALEKYLLNAGMLATVRRTLEQSLVFLTLEVGFRDGNF